MNKNYFKELLRKYLDNQLNQAEQRTLESWYNSFGDSENIPPLQNREKKEKIYNELHKNLNLHLKKGKQRKLWVPYAIAASLFLAAFTTLLSYNSGSKKDSSLSSFQKIEVGNGKLKKVFLPDSSEVWINSGSELRFNPVTFTQTRDVFLDNGEAFFSVVKNPKSPFRVITPTVITQVYGTSFNVKAYRELDYSLVQVKTGLVKVRSASDSIGEMLAANQSVVYYKNSKTMVQSSNSSFIGDSWIKGETIVNNASFAELALLMQHRFNIRLVSAGPSINKHHYSLTIKQDKPLEYYLKLICAIHNNHYRRKNNEITIY